MQECKTITICSNVRATVIICHLGNMHVLSLKSPVNCIYHYLCISIHSEQNQSKKQQHGLSVIVKKGQYNTSLDFLLSKKIKKQST